MNIRNLKISIIAVSTFLIFSGSVLAQGANQASDNVIDVDALLDSGQYDEARKALLSVTRNPFELLLFEVDIALRQGRTSDAIEMLEDVLAKFPQFEVARFKLAQTLFQDKQFERARYQLTILRDQVEDPEYADYFATQISEIDEQSPLSSNFTFSISPDTNINNGSEKGYLPDIFGTGNNIEYTNPPELRPNFGWRFELGVSGEYRYAIADKHNIIFGINASTNKYTYETLDHENASFSMNYVFEDANNRVSIGPSYTRYWGDGKSYTYNASTGEADVDFQDEDYETIGYALSIRRKVDSKSTISAYFSHRDSTMVDRKESGSDNLTNFVNGRYTYQLDPRSAVYFGLGFTTYKQRSGAVEWRGSANYDAVDYSIGYRRFFESQWFVDGNLKYTRRKYNDQVSSYTRDWRDDSVFSLDWEIRNQNWKIGKSAPSLNCNASNTNSNVPGKSFSSFSCGIYLTNQF